MRIDECPMWTLYGLSSDYNSYDSCCGAGGVFLSHLGHCNLVAEFSVIIGTYGNGLWHKERIRNSLN